MTKKIFALVMVVSVLGAFVAGCGSGEKAEEGTTASTATTGGTATAGGTTGG